VGTVTLIVVGKGGRAVYQSSASRTRFGGGGYFPCRWGLRERKPRLLGVRSSVRKRSRVPCGKRRQGESESFESRCYSSKLPGRGGKKTGEKLAERLLGGKSACEGEFRWGALLQTGFPTRLTPLEKRRTDLEKGENKSPKAS